jgi:ABC-type Fe3+/spermidine/putrescine transport system ATPase subunit
MSTYAEAEHDRGRGTVRLRSSQEPALRAPLRISGLTISYGQQHAVKGIDFAVAPGSVFGLVGPSGSGKTSILRCVGGYVSPTSGMVVLGDEDITHVPVSKRDFGMVFQGYALFQNMTVRQNVAFGLKARHVPRKFLSERVAEVIDLTDLVKLADRYPRELSGGQQQRVALARALAIRPRVLLFDEPMGALDAQLKDAVLEGIRRIQQELSITTLYVTHDQREAFAICDTIAIINDGQLAALGTPESLYNEPPTRFAATFVGSGTLFSLDVRKMRDRQSMPMLPGQSEHAVLCIPLSVDTDRLAVFLRPEAVQCLVNEDLESTLGIVEWARYQGRDYLVGVRVSGHDGLLVASTAPKVSVGQNIWIRWRPEDAVVIEENAEGQPTRSDGQGLTSNIDAKHRDDAFAPVDEDGR